MVVVVIWVGRGVGKQEGVADGEREEEGLQMVRHALGKCDQGKIP